MTSDAPTGRVTRPGDARRGGAPDDVTEGCAARRPRRPPAVRHPVTRCEREHRRGAKGCQPTELVLIDPLTTLVLTLTLTPVTPVTGRSGAAGRPRRPWLGHGFQWRNTS